jgi:hypothetical protein
MRKILLTLALFANLAFSQIADLEIQYLGGFKSLPDFTLAGSTYSISLPKSADKINLIPTGHSADVAITGGFENRYLPIGESTYPITVGANSYTVKVTRQNDGGQVDTKNTLSNLTVREGANALALNPSFAENSFAYSVQVPFTAGNVSVEAPLSYRYGGLIYENETGNEVSNENIVLTPGQAWVMKIRVIAENATVANGVYTLILNKMAGNTNNNLASLDVFLNGDSWDNVLYDFDPSILIYTLPVDSLTTTATVKSTKQEQFFGEFVGQNEWVNRALTYGNNPFSITVKSETGVPKTYTLTIVRESPLGPSSSSSEPELSSSSEPELSSSSEPELSSSSDSEPELSSSSDASAPSSSSVRSSSSGSGTPIRLPQIASNQIHAKATTNAIILENLPNNAKVQIYNLQGRRIYSNNNHENPKILQIMVQTKGLYFVKINKTTIKLIVK